MTGSLPLPPFYDPRHASDFRYSPHQQQLFDAAADWRRTYGIRPSGEDKVNVHLMLVDLQRDFCFPEGSLYVGGRSGAGALEDNQRTAEFIYRNLARLTNITATMDTHLAFQIFSPSFWIDADGKPLIAHRELTTEDITSERVRPNPAIAKWLCNGDYAWLMKQVHFYCERLEDKGKYKLYLWPPHCIVGSEGHALVGVIHEARLFHSYVRDVQSWVEMKGSNPLTEHYSVLGPEVLHRHDGEELDHKNFRFVKTLVSADAVIIAGQAASHCVKSTVDDLLEEISRLHDPSLAPKLYLLTDCMSSVAVPDGKGGFVADFTPQTEAAFRRYSAAGMHLVKSTDPIETWPGMKVA